MDGVNSFIAEIAVDFVHPVKTTHDQPLQIQFRRDAQVQIHVECVVVGDEWPRGSSAQNRMHHRSVNFHVTTRIEKTAQLADDLCPLNKNLPRLLVYDQVQIPAAVSYLGVCKPVPLLWKRQQRFRQKLKVLDPHREFVRFGAE